MNKYLDISRKLKTKRKVERMCVLKKRYDTNEQAFQKGQRVYRCPHCKGWHRSGELSELVSVCHKRIKQ